MKDEKSFLTPNAQRPTPKNRGGFTLVEILLVTLVMILIGGALVYFYFGKSSDQAKKLGGGDMIHTPITRANDVVCQTNLGSVRQAIEAERASDADGHPPQSLNLLSLPAELLSCPVGHEPYSYDPTTGQVHCTHPGHENY
jgi:hypothetical protein